jgi:hypothetical protein
MRVSAFSSVRIAAFPSFRAALHKKKAAGVAAFAQFLAAVQK